MSAAEVSAWLKSAMPGDRLVYCVGPAMLPGPTLKLTLELVREQKALTHKHRGQGGLLEHVLVKLAARAACRTAAPEIDDHAERIFEAIERAAERRRRCQSDRDLAKIAGLSSRNQAKWRLTKLVKEGRLRIETIATEQGPWRVAEIVGRRLKTAPPPAVQP